MKILVFIDPADQGEWALAAALDLTRGLARSVVLLGTKDAVNSHPNLLDDAARKFEGIEGVEVETRVRDGSAREAILAESRDGSPAITVFPPAGRHVFSRMLRGSRVKKLVHDSPSTVLVARKPVSEHIRRILVTVSGGPFSETTLLSALEISGAMGAELRVLHVSSSVAIPHTDIDPTEKTSLAKRVGEDLSEVLDKLKLAESLRMRDGMVVNEIIAECEEGHYDLLVLGQHLAIKATGGPLSEDIAETLAVRSPIPVVVVRPRRWAAERT